MAQFFHTENASPITIQADSVKGPVRQRIAVNGLGVRRSNTPWDIRKEEEVMKTLGFRRKDYDLAVTSFHDEKGFPSMPPGYSERHEMLARKRRKKQAEVDKGLSCSGCNSRRSTSHHQAMDKMV
jgi:hypothetical protein